MADEKTEKTTKLWVRARGGKPFRRAGVYFPNQWQEHSLTAEQLKRVKAETLLMHADEVPAAVRIEAEDRALQEKNQKDAAVVAKKAEKK